MGGVLDITADPPATWLPQSRVFDGALRALAAELPGDPELAGRLASAGEGGVAYADLRTLEPERFRALVVAARRAVAVELRRGAAVQSAVKRLRYGQSLLRALLEADPRARPAHGEEELAIREGVVWRAPAPAVRLAREHLAAAAGGDPASLDLRALPPPGFAPLLDAAAWMEARYAPGTNLEAHADAALAVLHPPIGELAARLRTDPRAG